MNNIPQWLTDPLRFIHYLNNTLEKKRGKKDE